VASAIRIGNPARWEEAMGAMAASQGAIRAVSDAEILDAYRFLAAHEGVFCEPASAAPVAGLIKYGAEEAERILPLQHLLHQVWHDMAEGESDVARHNLAVVPRSLLADPDAVERADDRIRQPVLLPGPLREGFLR
jgi:threonine dehydratase